MYMSNIIITCKLPTTGNAKIIWEKTIVVGDLNSRLLSNDRASKPKEVNKDKKF